MEFLNEGPLARLWELAVFKDGLTPETVSQIDINATINALKTAPQLPLPVAGELLHALSRVLDSSAGFALEDAKETNRELYKTFKDQISVNDGGEIDKSANTAAPPMETGLELGDLSLPESLLGRRHQTAPQDMSIDAIVREDRSIDNVLREDVAGNAAEEGPVRSAEELEALEALDLGDGGDGDDDDENDGNDDGNMNVDEGDMFDFPTMAEGDSELGLDFGSDLQNSSSPPHTPHADHDIDVRIGRASSPVAAAVVEEPQRKRAPRRHGAPVDDVISITRPTKPSAHILRRLNSIPIQPEPEPEPNAGDDALILLDDATERLVDPAYVQAEMKKRRLGDEPILESQPSPLTGDAATDADLPSVANDAVMDSGEDWGMDLNDFGDEPSRIESDFEGEDGLAENGEDESGDEPEDTAEILKEGAAAAKAVLHSHLKKKGSVVQFDDIATSAQTRADTLMEVLALAARGRVAPHQESAWGPITITQL